MEKRKVAIFADAHALLEPTKAVLEDMKKRNISEIYSLGDNIGLGPNPKETIQLLQESKVKSLAGNYEDHIRIGVEPFSSYMTKERISNINWMTNQLSEEEKRFIFAMPHFLELNLGGKRIALVHFANDVRYDFSIHSALYYPSNVEYRQNAYEQFLYTNSLLALNDIARALNSLEYFYSESTKNEAFKNLRDWALNRKKDFRKEQMGYISYLGDPLFYQNGIVYQAKDYDAVIGGHVHFKIMEKSPSTLYYSTRALAMAYENSSDLRAYYIILHETEKDFQIEEVYVPYDREKMEDSILKLKIPNQTIRKYTNM